MLPTKPTQERAKLCQQAELWVIFHGYGFFVLAPGSEKEMHQIWTCLIADPRQQHNNPY